MSTANFFRVLYFQQIAELSNIFQNHTGGMIFLKIVANLTVLEGNFYREFCFVKLKVISILWCICLFGQIHFLRQILFFLFENIDLSS